MSKLTTLIKYYPKMMLWKFKYKKLAKIDFESRLSIYGTSLIMENNGEIRIDKGSNCRANLSLVIDGGYLEIGENCFFNNNCSIMCLENIKIGKGSMFGPNVTIVDNDHDYKNLNKKVFLTKSIIIGENVWIGANCVILRGSKIGDNCVIAAGTTVYGEIDGNKLIYQKKYFMEKNIKELKYK